MATVVVLLILALTILLGCPAKVPRTTENTRIMADAIEESACAKTCPGGSPEDTRECIEKCMEGTRDKRQKARREEQDERATREERGEEEWSQVQRRTQQQWLQMKRRKN